MKVYIGPYRKWIGPYQIADMLMFWSKNHDLKHKFGDWLANDKNDNPSRLNKVCNWIHEKCERKIKVRIDEYDTWNADHTLALIICPLLKKLKDDKGGVPRTDREDCPTDSIYDEKPDKDHWETGYHLERWEYILDEMIFAFEHKIDGDWDLRIYEKNDNHWTKEAMNERDEIQRRINNGIRLFGKYYNHLWT